MSKVLLMLLGGCVLLAGCAGGRSEFGCNATSTDSCMTMEQANEKAKTREEGSDAKPAATALPRLAEGPFSAIGRDAGVPPVAPVNALSRLLPRSATPGTKAAGSAPVSLVTLPARCSLPRCTGVDTPSPARLAEQTAQLWIAPWIDSQDVYHQPGKVLFVVRPATWGAPRSVL